MAELVAKYWWVCFFTVPALAVAIQAGMERAGAVDSLPSRLRTKLASFEHSYPGHWVVTATLRDGRRYSRVVIDARFRIASRVTPPFRLHEVRDVAWEGLADPADAPIVQLS